MQLLQQSAGYQKKIQANRRARQRREVRINKEVLAGTAPHMRDSFDATVYLLESERTPQADAMALQMSWTWAGDPWEAEICLTSMSVWQTQVPSSLTWAAALRGSWVLEPAWAEGEAYTGPVIKFRAAINTKRVLWISDAFAQAHPDVSNVLQACSRLQGSRWTLIQDLETWLHAKQHLTSKRMSATAIAAVTAEEAADYQDVPHVFDASSLYEFVSKVDKESSRLCVAQM